MQSIDHAIIHSFLLFDFRPHACTPFCAQSVRVHCSPTSLWLDDCSKLHPADTNPGRPRSPLRSAAGRQPRLLRCLLSRTTGGRHGNRISPWRQMRSANAWGLTFGEVCCAPGPDRRREILLWSWDRWCSEDWKHSWCHLIKDSAGELQYEFLQPQHYSGRSQNSDSALWLSWSNTSYNVAGISALWSRIFFYYRCVFFTFELVWQIGINLVRPRPWQIGSSFRCLHCCLKVCKGMLPLNSWGPGIRHCLWMLLAHGQYKVRQNKTSWPNSTCCTSRWPG